MILTSLQYQPFSPSPMQLPPAFIISQPDARTAQGVGKLI
jgi:hypothetical protein